MATKKLYFIFLILFVVPYKTLCHANFSIDALALSSGLSYSHEHKEFFTDSTFTIDKIDNTGIPLQASIDFNIIENNPILFTSNISYVKFNGRYLADISLGFKYPVMTGKIVTFYEFGAGYYYQSWNNNYFHTQHNNRTSDATGLHLAVAPHWLINKRTSIGIKFQIDFINQYTTLIKDCSFAQINHDFLLSMMLDFRYKIGKS